METRTHEIPRLKRQLIDTMETILSADPNAVLVIQDAYRIAVLKPDRDVDREPEAVAS